MIRIDEPALPSRGPDDLRAEVVHRSGRFRRRRRVRGVAMTSGAVALALIVFATSLDSPSNEGGPTRVESERGPAGEGSVTTVAPEAGSGPAASVAPGSPGSPGGAAPATAGRAPRPTATTSPRPATGPAPAHGARGAQVLFVEGYTLFTASTDGTGKRRIADQNPSDGRWSRDGKHVLSRPNHLYVHDVLGDFSGRVVFRNRDEPSEDDAVEAATWMPDSRTIVFLRRQSRLHENTYGIWTVDIHTGALRQVRPLAKGFYEMSVTEDGRIAYDCQVAGVNGICLTDLSGADRGFWPMELSINWEISPDGRWIAYLDFDEVVLYAPDGSKRTIAQTRALGHPAWYPDSSRVAFSLDWPDKQPSPCNTPRPCPDDGGVWSVRTDGTDIRPVTTGSKDALVGMAWAP